MEESSELWEEAFFTTSSSSSSQFIQPNGGIWEERLRTEGLGLAAAAMVRGVIFLTPSLRIAISDVVAIIVSVIRAWQRSKCEDPQGNQPSRSEELRTVGARVRLCVGAYAFLG